MSDPALGTLGSVLIDLEATPPTGWGTQKTGQPVSHINVTAGGSGYVGTVIGFTGGAGTGAAAVAIVVGGVLKGISVTDGGSGYTSAPTVTITGAPGTGAAATSVLQRARQIPVLKNDISATQDLTDNASIRGDFNENDPFNEKKKGGGAISLIPNAQTLPLLMKMYFGNLTSVVNATPGLPTVHSAKILNNIPYSAIIESLFAIPAATRYGLATGMRINKMSIPIQPTGPLQLNLDMLGKDETYGSSTIDATPKDWRSISAPIDHTMLLAADLLQGGVAIGAIGSGNIDFDAKLSADDYRAGGSAARGSLVPGRNSVSGSLDLLLESAAILTLLTGGSFTSLSLKWTIVAAEKVGSVLVTSQGTGYTSAPTVGFTGGGGTGATAVARVSGGAVTGVEMTNFGSGYTSVPTVTFTGGAGADATALANIGPWFFQVDLWRAFLQKTGPTLPGDGPIKTPVQFRCAYDNTNLTMATLTVQNDQGPQAYA